MSAAPDLTHAVSLLTRIPPSSSVVRGLHEPSSPMMSRTLEMQDPMPCLRHVAFQPRFSCMFLRSLGEFHSNGLDSHAPRVLCVKILCFSLFAIGDVVIERRDLITGGLLIEPYRTNCKWPVPRRRMFTNPANRRGRSGGVLLSQPTKALTHLSNPVKLGGPRHQGQLMVRRIRRPCPPSAVPHNLLQSSVPAEHRVTDSTFLRHRP